MRKIYILDNGMTAGKISTTYCGVKVNMEFSGGNPAAGIKAKLETDSLFVQDAIEHDACYGRDIKLWKAFGEVKPKAEPKVDGKAEVKDAEADDVKPKVKKVAKVKNVNDAIAYFTELGETVETDADIETLCAKHNVEFPNLKA